MATQVISRSLPKTLILASVFSRSFSSTATATATLSASSHSSFSLLRRLRPFASIVATDFRRFSPTTIVRDLATRATSSSLNDPNPNWSNRPPKETILLEGCDFEHWLVVVEKPEGDPTRDEIIDSYIKTLAMVLGSEEEARMKIYSVSTRCYFAFGCLVSEEISYKIKELPKVRWVLPDSYLDVKNKDYGGEPFIDGHAVPYDPKYHEEWIRNNARANERNRRNDRPRNFDRSRNFERRRENMQRDFQNTGPNMGGAPQNNMGGAPQNNMGGPPPNNMGGPPPNNNFVGVPPRSGMPPPNYGGMPQNNMGGMSPNNYGGAPPPPNNYGGAPPPSNNYGGAPPPPNNYGGGAPPPPNNYGGGAPPPPNNYGGGAPPPPNNYGGGAPPPPSNFGGAPRPPPPSNYGGGAPPPPSNYGGAPPGNYGGGAPPSNYGGAPPTNGGGFPPQSHYREMHSNTGWSSNKVSE